MNCDEYYSYNSLAGLVKSGDEEVVKHDPWELVSEAVQRMKRNGDVMRADRLKQVMQQMDSSFDEKNVGKSKFSLFVAEAAKKGLLTLNKLENGQYEVDVPRAASATGTVSTEAAPSAEPAENGDGRRPRRDSRGRGRDRTPRGEPRADRPAPAARSTAAQDAAPAASREAIAAPAPRAQTREAPATPARPPAAGEIGSTGLRLTREEAFDLVRRAVTSLVSGDAAAAASLVRSTARALLGRDSESLSERNFTRILQDAHDADLVDLRRRGNDYEVAAAAGGAPVATQLAAAETANPPAVKPLPAAPRGMSARGGGRGPMGRQGAPPAHILNVGVVGSRATATPPVVAAIPAAAAAAPSQTDVAAAETAAAPSADEPSGTPSKPARGRKRAAAKKSTAKKTTAPAAPVASTDQEPAAAVEGAPARRKRATRGGRKNAKSPAGGEAATSDAE
jgi:hypothetical protein